MIFCSSWQRTFRVAAFIACAVAATIAAGTAPAFASAEQAQRYVLDAQKEIAAGNLQAAEIQLRNAAQADPGNPAIHIDLAKVYIRLGNFPAAEAEARVASRNHASDDQVAPLLADAMLHEGKINQLLNQIRPGNRAPKAEAAVRATLGLAHLALHEIDKAEALLQDAARLDSRALLPKIGLAQLYLIKGQVADAESEIKGALALAPDNPEVLRTDGEVLRAKGDLDGALARFNTALAKEPGDPSVLMSRANLLVQRNDLTAAQRDVDEILKRAPKSLPANYLSALIAAKQGNLHRANALLEPISAGLAQLSAAFPEALYLEGAVKYGLGQYEQAETFANQFIARMPHQPLGKRLLALILLRKGKTARAIKVLKPVVDADPGDIRSASLLAQAYLASGKPDQAVEIYQRVAGAQPNNANLQTQLALLRLRAGKIQEGLTDLENITNTDQGAKVAGPLLIVTDLREGKIANAESTAEAMVKRSPDDPIAQNLLGVVRVAQAKFAEAEQIYKNLIKKDPKFIAAQRNLAQVYVLTRRQDEAKRTLHQILQTHPDDVPTLIALANLNIAEKDEAGAVSLLKHAQKAAPKNPAPGLQLLRLYASQKNWRQANSFGQQLLGQFPDNATVRDAAATVRADSGDPAGAVKLYRPLVATYPASAEVLARFSALQSRAGDDDGARRSLAKAVALAPDNFGYMTALVNLDYKTKGIDGALATAHSFAPKKQVASDLLVAEVLARAKRVSDAITELTKAQRSHPAAPILIRLAALVDGTGHHEQAETMLEAWLKDHSDASDVRMALASIYISNHEYNKAQPQYEAVIAQVPKNAVALNNLAWLYARQQNPKAESFAERAYRLAPTPQIADTLGWILAGKGDTSKSLPYLEKAGAALPEDLDVQYHLAFALNATGAKDKARIVLERALKSDRDFDSKAQAEKLLAKLGQG